MKLELRNATRRYGRESVFEKQNILIPSGSLVALLGDNGEGKTTLIECLFGIQKLDEGELFWDDESFDRHNIDLRRRAFYMPDNPPVQAQNDGLTEIASWFTMWGVEKDTAIKNALELLEDFKVLEEAGKTLSSLSRGQLYKVALSGFLSLGADLWLIDEPLASGMDSKGIEVFKRCCWDAIARGVTVVYTTQLEELARSFSTEICHVEGVSISLEKKEEG